MQGVAQTQQNGSGVRPGCGRAGGQELCGKAPPAPCLLSPAAHMQPRSWLVTGLGVWDSSGSLSGGGRGGAVSSLARRSPSFLSHFCLGVIHFHSATALLFSILSSSAFLISCKFLYNHTLPHKHEIITDNFSACAGYCSLNVEVKS